MFFFSPNFTKQVRFSIYKHSYFAEYSWHALRHKITQVKTFAPVKLFFTYVKYSTTNPLTKASFIFAIITKRHLLVESCDNGNGNKVIEIKLS